MWMWLGSVALAGTVYVNGVDVSALRDTTLTDVTVRFDANGDVHITAPQYEIQVVSPDGDADATATPVQPAPAPAPESSRATPPAGQGVEEGRWWLVTEDERSHGHEVEVLVNGASVLTVRSGEEQRIEDLGPWLRPGENTVLMRSRSAEARGGPLYLYIGTGSTEEGTLVLDAPSVQFGLGPTRDGPFERKYSVSVP